MDQKVVEEEAKVLEKEEKAELSEANREYLKKMKEYKNRMALAFTKAFLNPQTEFRIPFLPLVHEDLDVINLQNEEYTQH